MHQVDGLPSSEHAARSRRLRRCVFLSAGALALLGVPALAQAALAPHTQSFTFSGAVTGTLKGGCGSPTGGYGGDLAMPGSLKGSPASLWLMSVNTPLGGKNGGTFKDFKRGADGMAPSSIVLQGRASPRVYNWISTTGVVTTTSTSGHLHVTFGPDVGVGTGLVGKGTIRITGSWNCPS